MKLVNLMEEIMNTEVVSKYHRTTPVRQFDLNQTLYTTVFEQNKNNMDVDAIGFLGKSITFKELKKNVDRLADAYTKIGVKEGETVGICTINMPIVQENLLALSKIGATSKWIDLRIKGKDLVKNINESNCQVLVVFDGVIDAIMEIIDETEVSNVLVAPPCSIILSSTTLSMLIPVKVKILSVGFIPANSPLCVPCIINSETTYSPSKYWRIIFIV